MNLPPSDRPAKIGRIRALLDSFDAQSIVLTSAESLSWLFEGARVNVPLGGAPVLAAIVHRSGELEVTAYSNEAARLISEELDVDVTPVPWFGSLVVEGDGLSESAVLPELRAARAALLPRERARYATFGVELARAATRVIRQAEPQTSERALAALAAYEIVALGAEPVVLLVAGQDRVAHRHPLPTTGALGDRAMLVIGARRHGLVVNLTRWVAEDPHESVTDAALAEVEADAFAATRPGRALFEVLADIGDSYPRPGLAAAVGLKHHLGGPDVGGGRDPRATPTASDVVQDGQAFAWNPSAPGSKVEDTVVIDAGGVTVLSSDPEWPTRTVRGVPRPLTMPYGS